MKSIYSVLSMLFALAASFSEDAGDARSFAPLMRSESIIERDLSADPDPPDINTHRDYFMGHSATKYTYRRRRVFKNGQTVYLYNDPAKKFLKATTTGVTLTSAEKERDWIYDTWDGGLEDLRFYVLIPPTQKTDGVVLYNLKAKKTLVVKSGKIALNDVSTQPDLGYKPKSKELWTVREYDGSNLINLWHGVDKKTLCMNSQGVYLDGAIKDRDSLAQLPVQHTDHFFAVIEDRASLQPGDVVALKDTSTGMALSADKSGNSNDVQMMMPDDPTRYPLEMRWLVSEADDSLIALQNLRTKKYLDMNSGQTSSVSDKFEVIRSKDDRIALRKPSDATLLSVADGKVGGNKRNMTEYYCESWWSTELFTVEMIEGDK